jgi:hypothetical protein
MKTGLAGFDAVIGHLGLGELHCITGRPCTGKTLLLLHIALGVHRRYETNVVFATAQEFPEQIIAMAPAPARSCLVELPSLQLMRGELEFPQGRGPCIYLVDVQAVGPTWPHYLAHDLNVSQVRRCDLLVSNGWTVYAERGSYIKHVVGSVPYRLHRERPATLLSAATLARAKRFARASGVATIYGVRTAWNDAQEAGPRLEDLLRLRTAVTRSVVSTVLLHRPELYLPHGGGREAVAGIVELAATGEGSSRRGPAFLQYDAAKRTFRSRGRSRGSC